MTAPGEESASTGDVMAMPPTPLEIMATVIARDLRDGEWVEVGANLPVPRAGALLAHLTHGPNMTVMLGMTKAYLHDEPVVDDYAFITDVRAMQWAEAYYPHDRLLADQRSAAMASSTPGASRSTSTATPTSSGSATTRSD